MKILLLLLLGVVSLATAAPIGDSQALDWDCNWACKLVTLWPPSSASSATLNENNKEEPELENLDVEAQ
ncbi:hypothetical protein E4T39_01888 [Aureobasidium subglaciale]|nr:hypothetical protein E4T39_01888 [Aureobasidium subglaciale]